jgi:hypothetical protein
MGGRFEKLKPVEGTCAARLIDIHGRTVGPPIRWVDRWNCELLNGFKESAARKQKGVEQKKGGGIHPWIRNQVIPGIGRSIVDLNQV